MLPGCSQITRFENSHVKSGIVTGFTLNNKGAAIQSTNESYPPCLLLTCEWIATQCRKWRNLLWSSDLPFGSDPHRSVLKLIRSTYNSI